MKFCVVAPILLLVAYNIHMAESTLPLDFCLWFRGSCETSCPRDSFAISDTNWCWQGMPGRQCCIKYNTPSPSTITTTKTTTTPTTTTIPTTTATTTTTTTPTTTATTTTTTITTPTTATTTTTPTTTTPATTSTTEKNIRLQPNCGVAEKGLSPAGRIIGGEEAEKCELPWMVSISTGPCGGALIDDRHIVTAAHCFGGVSDSRWPIVTIGEYNKSEDAPTEKFSTRDARIIKHPGFVLRTYFNDIAIIKLNRSVEFSKYRCIRPLCLPSPQSSFPTGSRCLVAGWGVTQPHYNVFNPPVSNVVRKVLVDLVDENICNQRFSGYYDNTTEICAGRMEGGKDSCDGDSGGPLMCQYETGSEYYLAGIVSSGSDCAQPNTPAIYTDVSRFLPWIHSVIQNED